MINSTVYHTMGLLDIFYHGPETLKIVSPPVGVYHDLARANPVTLQLREKILSLGGDDFSITDAATGKGVLKCRGVTFTMHERKSKGGD
jgi:hypothetical protein